MLSINELQVQTLEDSQLKKYVINTMSALSALADEQGQPEPEKVARVWFEGAVRIADRYAIEDGQEIAVLALIVADLGADFDLQPENAVLADMLNQDQHEGATRVAEFVASNSPATN